MGVGFGVNEKGTGVNGEMKTGKRVLDGDEKTGVWILEVGDEKRDG